MRKALLGLALLLAGSGLSGCDRGKHPEQVNTIAPGFSISDGSQSADLSKLRGKVVLLNFWFSRCVPCIEEIPSLMALQHQMPDLAVVAISTDPDEDEGVYKKFLLDHHVDLLTVRDSQQKVNALYGTFRYPETYVIDRKGMLRRKFIGAQTWTSPEIMDYLSKM